MPAPNLRLVPRRKKRRVIDWLYARALLLAFIVGGLFWGTLIAVLLRWRHP